MWSQLRSSLLISSKLTFLTLGPINPILINRYVVSPGEMPTDTSDTEADKPLHGGTLHVSIPCNTSQKVAPQVQNGTMLHAATGFADSICISGLPLVGAFEHSRFIQALLEHAFGDR
jgi:hypothetical protein